jgi:hypothetical protein
MRKVIVVIVGLVILITFGIFFAATMFSFAKDSRNLVTEEIKEEYGLDNEDEWNDCECTKYATREDVEIQMEERKAKSRDVKKPLDKENKL